MLSAVTVKSSDTMVASVAGRALPVLLSAVLVLSAVTKLVPEDDLAS
jgi:hypothetical protein